MATLGKKLAILISILAGGQRSQTIHAINTLDMVVTPHHCVIPLYDTLKQTRPRHHLPPLQFKVYTREPKLCVVTNLMEYLNRTQRVRNHEPLFLSYHQTHKPVSKDTITRWCRQIMSAAGIDIEKYVTHSSRSAASSFAKRKGVPCEKLLIHVVGRLKEPLLHIMINQLRMQLWQMLCWVKLGLLYFTLETFNDI